MAELAVHDAKRLKELQALPLDRKIMIAQARIIEWHKHFNGNVFVSFSGGKDSTVLLHLVRQLFPNVPAVFSNTGLEYPEIQKFAREKGAEFITPKMRFTDVVLKYGYPLISKEASKVIYDARRYANKNGLTQARKRVMGVEKYETSQFSAKRYNVLAHELPVMIADRCCYVMKKGAFHGYMKETGRVPYIGTLTEESLLRKQAWIEAGCNAFDAKYPGSRPLSFWTNQDILTYIVQYGIEIASVYGEVISVDSDGFTYPPRGLDGEIRENLMCSKCQRTGCIFCAYGLHKEKGLTRFQRLAKTHPRQYEYCVGGGQ